MESNEMNIPEIEAQAQALCRQAGELWDRSNALTAAEYAAAGLPGKPFHADYTCEAGKPLRAQATALREQAKQLRTQAQATGSFTASATANIGTTMTDASASYTRPEVTAAVEQALQAMRLRPAGTEVPAAVIETATQIAAREAEARAVEADKLVANIVGDPGIVARAAAERQTRAAGATEAAAVEAAAAARRADAAAIAARIIAA